MKKIVKSFLFSFVFLVLGFIGVQAQEQNIKTSEPAIISEVYIANEGRKPLGVYNNIIESFKISIENPFEGMEIRYKAYIENKGWTDWMTNGKEAGSPRSKLKIEAVAIELIGNTDDYNVLYKTHIRDYGWSSYTGNGKTIGSEGYNLGINGLIVDITDTENYNKNVSTDPVKINFKSKSKKLDVPIIMQRPELPTGCEITSVTMMLKYYGADVDKVKLAYEMPYHRSDPNQGYVGNPFLKSGWTINPPALCNLIRKYTGNAVDLTGSSIEVIENQISKNKPVVVYVQMHDFNVHAITITGYDEKNFYYNDPWTGEKSEVIDKKVFQETWKTQNKRAISY